MSYVKSLRTTLKEKNQELFNRLREIEDLAKSVLIYTVSKFPYYTPHDFKHSLNVEENLNWLIPDEKKKELNSYEIFFLIISSWLHDWGMVGKPDEDPLEIRENHHVRTEEYFEKLHDKIRLSLNEARIIGRICRGHRQEDLLGPKFDDLFFRSNIRIRTRFLSALLRIADECDVTENRVPEIIYYSLSPNGVSDEEFRKHLSIIGIGQPEPYKLQLSGVARDPKGVKVLEEVRKRIQNEINNVKIILAKEDIVLDYTELRVDTRGFINKPIEFVVDREKVVDLLIGKSLYHRFDAGIRELLQNSIDACRLRNSLEKGYTPIIIFSFSKEVISIDDNGIGMSFDTASRYLSNIGASFFVSKEFEDLKAGKVLFDPISRFGIGILSCFLISSKVVIETMKENNDPCRFIIEDLSEGWRYEAGSRKTVGTKISLFLNKKGRQLILEKVLQHYAKAVEFPIQIINEETGEKRLLQQRWNHTMDEFKESRYYVLLGDKAPLEPTLSRMIKTDGLEGVYYYYKYPRLFPFVFGIHFFSYHGLYVGEAHICPSISDRLIVLANCTKNLVDLDVSRESFVVNEKHHDFVRRLYENFFKFIDTIFAERTKGKELSDFDGCIEFAQVCKKFFSTKRITSPVIQKTMTSFLLRMVYPIIDINGFHLLAGESIFSRKDVKKVYNYSLGLQDCKHHIKSVEPFLKEMLKVNDIVVFDIAPTVRFAYQPTLRQTIHPFEVLCKSRNIEYETLGLPKLLRNVEFKRVPTPLDQLLPENSFMTKMPPQFRSFVIANKPFSFGQESEVRGVYDTLCMRELFSYDNDILKCWDARLNEEKRAYDVKCPCQKEAPAEFVFDIEDLVIKTMLEKSDAILSDRTIRDAVERYFRYLVVLCLPYYVELEHYLSVLMMLEKTVLSWLEYEGTYKPLLKRMGKMGAVFRHYVF